MRGWLIPYMYGWCGFSVSVFSYIRQYLSYEFRLPWAYCSKKIVEGFWCYSYSSGCWERTHLPCRVITMVHSFECSMLAPTSITSLKQLSLWLHQHHLIVLSITQGLKAYFSGHTAFIFVYLLVYHCPWMDVLEAFYSFISCGHLIFGPSTLLVWHRIILFYWAVKN